MTPCSAIESYGQHESALGICQCAPLAVKAHQKSWQQNSDRGGLKGRFIEDTMAKKPKRVQRG